MEFIIKDPHPSRTYNETNSISIKLILRKSYRPLWIRFLLGLLMLGIGLIDKKGELNLPDSLESNAHITYYNFHFAASLGIALILLSTVALIQYRQQIREYKSTAESLVKRREKYLNMTEMVINEEGVTSTNTLVRSEVKWNGFLTYTYYQGFLFFNTGNEINSGFAIDSRLVEQSRFAELLAFIKKKLPEKKA